jgi:tRNA dimethylallyltransferase
LCCSSALGVWLAGQFGGEVLACDSTQVYRDFTIGVAKPSISDRRGIPHHLIDILRAEEAATAAGYRQLALSVLEDLRELRRLRIFTAFDFQERFDRWPFLSWISIRCSPFKSISLISSAMN